MSYLSDEWFHGAGAADAPPSAGGLVIQHVVGGGPAGEVSYYVQVGGGTLTIVRGRAAQPDVTFAEDYATAAAIASGEMSAAAALLAGRIRVGGDMATLIAHQELLAVDDPVPAALRAETTY